MDRFSPTNFLHFEEDDFTMHPFFQDWVLQEDEDSALFWHAFVEQHPHKKKAVDNARALLLQLRFKEHALPDEEVNRHFIQHLASIELLGKPRQNKLRNTFTGRWMVAAVFAGLLASPLFYFYRSVNKPEQQLAASRYGEIKTILLPDSSAITLNAHSSIRFSTTWSKQAAREVWLEGEAFFAVKHTNDQGAYEHFLVHGNNFTVEVLGTRFNIRQRRGVAEIVLQTGSIRLQLYNPVHTSILMKPGEQVTYQPETNRLERKVTQPQDYLAWKENKLVLNNPTLEEITHYLEDNYGKKIVIADASIKNKKIEGPILLNNLDDALFIITTVLNTRIQKKDNTIIISAR